MLSIVWQCCTWKPLQYIVLCCTLSSRVMQSIRTSVNPVSYSQELWKNLAVGDGNLRYWVSSTDSCNVMENNILLQWELSGLNYLSQCECTRDRTLHIVCQKQETNMSTELHVHHCWIQKFCDTIECQNNWSWSQFKPFCIPYRNIQWNLSNKI